MGVEIVEYSKEYFEDITKMITELINFHRKLNNSPKEYWQNDEESRMTLAEWILEGKIYIIFEDNNLAGFFYVKFGGNQAAWLEDLYIAESYRKKGIGSIAMKRLDEILRGLGTTALFVDVIPRNVGALDFYRECGFDHLNILQLRKNYDERLNKDEEIEILGMKFKKY